MSLFASFTARGWRFNISNRAHHYVTGTVHEVGGRRRHVFHAVFEPGVGRWRATVNRAADQSADFKGASAVSGREAVLDALERRYG